MTRGGARIDAAPIELSDRIGPGSVRAASDGSGFAVSWLEATGVKVAVIDSSGHVGTASIDNIPSSVSAQPLSFLRFANGAYQLALLYDSSADAITISVTGEVVQREHITEFGLHNPSARTATFDGHRLVAMWSDGKIVDRLVKEIGGSAATITLLTPPAGYGFAYGGLTIAPDDAGGYLFLFVITDAINFDRADRDARYVVRLSDRAELTGGAYDHLLSRGLFSGGPQLVRTDAGWLVSWVDDDYATTHVNAPYRVISALSGALSQAGGEVRLPNVPAYPDLVDGHGSEALVIYEATVSAGIIPGSRLAVRAFAPAVTRGRAVGH